MTRAERAEAAKRLRELAHEIYDTLEEMEAILKEVAPEELDLARVYWMAHIDRSLFNVKNWREVRFITLQDTITILEEA
jgi:hypothetical protein